MEEKSVSRRDALKLARLGALLGAGLCVAESAQADPGQERSPINRFTVKLSTRGVIGSAVSKELPLDVIKRMMGDGSVRLAFKFFRENAAGQPETIYTDTLQFKWDKQ